MLEMISVVFKSLFSASSTRNYPYVRRPNFEAARGHIEIDIDKCAFCGMCARKCPADALEVERATAHWTIDPFRCIACGACVETCPKQCLTMSNAYTLPVVDKYCRTLEGAVPVQMPKRRVAEPAPATDIEQAAS